MDPIQQRFTAAYKGAIPWATILQFLAALLAGCAPVAVKRRAERAHKPFTRILIHRKAVEATDDEEEAAMLAEAGLVTLEASTVEEITAFQAAVPPPA